MVQKKPNEIEEEKQNIGTSMINNAERPFYVRKCIPKMCTTRTCTTHSLSFARAHARTHFAHSESQFVMVMLWLNLVREEKKSADLIIWWTCLAPFRYIFLFFCCFHIKERKKKLHSFQRSTTINQMLQKTILNIRSSFFCVKKKKKSLKVSMLSEFYYQRNSEKVFFISKQIAMCYTNCNAMCL